jgi:hypothetical protein
MQIVSGRFESFDANHLGKLISPRRPPPWCCQHQPPELFDFSTRLGPCTTCDYDRAFIQCRLRKKHILRSPRFRNRFLFMLASRTRFGLALPRLTRHLLHPSFLKLIIRYDIKILRHSYGGVILLWVYSAGCSRNGIWQIPTRK